MVKNDKGNIEIVGNELQVHSEFSHIVTKLKQGMMERGIEKEAAEKKDY